MTLYAIYQVKRSNATGKISVNLEVRDLQDRVIVNGQESDDVWDRWNAAINNIVWYGKADNQSGPSLVWDTTTGEPASGNPSSWTNTLNRNSNFDTSDTTSQLSVNLAGMEYVTAVGGTDVFEDPGIKFGPLEWSALENNGVSQNGNTEYAEFNISNVKIAPLAVDRIEPPVIDSIIRDDVDSGIMTYKSAYKTGASANTAPDTLALQIFRTPELVGTVAGWDDDPVIAPDDDGSTHTSVLTDLPAGTTIYLRLVAMFDGTPSVSNVYEYTTSYPLAQPTAHISGYNNVAGTTGAGGGTLYWDAVYKQDGTAVSGYQVQWADDAAFTQNSGTQTVATTSYAFTDSAGKFFRVKALAGSNDTDNIETDYGQAVQAPALIEPEDDGTEPAPGDVDVIANRREMAAIPYLPNIPVEQIGVYETDLITKEYADAHYYRSSGDIPSGGLPFAVYGEDDGSSTKIVSPSYLESAIGALDLAYDITEITAYTVSSGGTTTGYKFAGVQLGASESGNQPTLISKAYADTAYAAADGYAGEGQTNAGLVWITSNSTKEGILISSASGTEGKISLDWASTSLSGWTWASTISYTVVSPAYVKAAIESLLADTSVFTNVGGNGYGGYIPKLDSNGKLNTAMIPDLAITDITTVTTKIYYGSGASSTYLTRDAAIAGSLPSSGVQKGDVYIFAPSLTDSERNTGGILVGTFICTGVDAQDNATWAEMYTPVDGVYSVNGLYGPSVTLGLTDIYAKPGTKFSSLSAIPNTDTYALWTGNYIASQIAAVTGSNISIASSQINDLLQDADPVDGDDFGTIGYAVSDIAVAAYVTSVVGTLGTASQADVSTVDVTDQNYQPSDFDGDTGLVTGDQVYEFVTNYVATAEHVHYLSDIKYTVGSTEYSYSAGTTIASTSTDGQLATAKAVFDYTPPITRIIATGSTAFGGIQTSLASTLGSETYLIPTAYAVQQYIVGLDLGNTYAAKTHDHYLGQSGTIYAATGAKADVATTISSYASASEDYKFATARAVYNYINSISAFAGASSGSGGKLVKFDSEGYIDTWAIRWDSGSFDFEEVSADAWIVKINDDVLSPYLKKTDAQTTYIKQGVAGNYGQWTSGSTYAVGDVVFHQGLLYRCVATSSTSYPNAGPGSIAPTGYGMESTTFWQPVTFSNLLRYVGQITGDGSATEFTVNHNLGVMDVDVTLVDDDTDTEVYPSVQYINSGQVKIGFGNPPANNKVYRVTVRA